MSDEDALRAAAEKKYPHVFSPIKVGPVEIKSRFYVSPHGTGYQTPAGPTDTFVAYYVERARGGCGVTFQSIALLPRRGFGVNATPFLDEAVPNFAAVAEAVHGAGAKIFGQLHYARIGNSWRYELGSPVAPLLGPSPTQLYDDFHVVHEMSVASIKKLIDAHRISSANLTAAGYDGIELHCAHGMLLETFLSPYFNHRTDEWGGSPENRLRFLAECLRAAREGAGPNLAVGIRLNADELVEGGLDQTATREIISRLVDLKLIDYVDLDIALEPEQYHFGMPSYFEKGHLYERYVRGVRSAAGDVPVFSALGRVTSVAQAERALAEGVCDMVGAARGFMTEPALIRNAIAGREDDSRTCIACNLCLTNNHGVFGCAINPTTGRERFWSEGSLVPGDRVVKVIVVGGGPAGLEAARVAVKKGHDVVLFEQRQRLGGQMSLWASLPGREVFATTPEWYERQLAKLGVSVRLGVEATADAVLAETPDAVIVATGARYVSTGESGYVQHPIPGHDRDFVYTPEQIIEDCARPQGNVFVLDDEGIHTGVGVAELLAQAGASVRLVTRRLHPAENIGPFDFGYVIARLRALGVELEAMRYVKEIGDHTVTTYDIHSHEERTDPVDAVVLATGRRSTDPLSSLLDGKVAQLFAAGDAMSPRGLSEAFYEGHRFARHAGEPGAPANFTEDYFSLPDGSRNQRPASMLREAGG